MSAARRKPSARPKRHFLPLPLRLLVRSGPLRAVVVLVVLAAAGGAALWYTAAARVKSDARFQLAPLDIETTPQPAWIRSNVKEQAVRDASLDGPLNILDPGLAERVFEAFVAHPWVAGAKVTKHAPARITVEVEYRRPVCMVEVTGGFYPVDRDGVWLPTDDFSPQEALAYPRLVGIDTMPVGPLGSAWGDQRVAAGARLAGALGPSWQELQLRRMVPRDASAARGAGQVRFELFTVAGTRIAWGRAPGEEIAGEPSSEDKLAWLTDYVHRHGTLDGSGRAHVLDVQTLAGLQVVPEAAHRDADDAATIR